jgi:hypothetical protein
MTQQKLKTMTFEELKNIIENANTVLDAPLTYPNFDGCGFHTNEMNDRNSWSRRKQEAIDELRERKKNW